MPEGRINITDPDSRVVKGLRGFIQGYNAQAVTNQDQIVIAADVVTSAPDFGHLQPMLDAGAVGTTSGPASTSRPGVVVADAGDRHTERCRHWPRAWDRGADPARGQQTLKGAAARLGRAANTRSCARCWPASMAARCTDNASR